MDSSNGTEPPEISAGFGVLGAIVWPTFMGCSTGEPGPGPVPLNEPFEDFNYKRGQIVWVTQPDGDVLGAAQVFVPKGVFTHFLFCHGPGPDLMIGAKQLDQPIIFDRPGVVDITPIRNQDYLPRQPI